MANIEDINEPWAGHSGLEVETFIKQQLAQLDQKFGFAEFNTQTTSIVFYDEEGGTQLFTLPLGGEIYDIAINANMSQIFYILRDETEKIMTIAPTTTLSYFGSHESQAFPESYTYVVSVDTGSGYTPKRSGEISTGGSDSFDIKPYLVNGENYIRISVTGATSGKVKSFVFTATLTTLSMSCDHAWQNVWREGSDYIVSGIHFAGNLVKYLHLSLTVNGQTRELARIEYRANQSYTTTATTYTIQASEFPQCDDNCIAKITLWMDAQGISTPSVSYNIMCVKEEVYTPLVAINRLVSSAVNYTSGTIFSYSVYNANTVSFDMSAIVNLQEYAVTTEPVVVTSLEGGQRYDFSYSLEVDTGIDNTSNGTLSITAIPYMDSDQGIIVTNSTFLDNSYSYPATPGALFYLNAAMRSNETGDYATIVNESGASRDGNFSALYDATWTGISWTNDGWGKDDEGKKALVVPAGSSVVFDDFAPLDLITDQAYSSGMTFEFLLKCGSPSSYTLPVFSIASGGETPVGILIYPTKIVVYGSNERNEVAQSVTLSESRMLHLVVTFTRNYENTSSRNLCSIYVNGISNVNFSFNGGSLFGNGEFTIGHPDTDAYLYKMRVYGTSLDSQAVLNNFFNSMTDGDGFNRRASYDKNQLLDGNEIEYGAVKRAGFNTMVITMTDDDTPVPSFTEQESRDGCTIEFEYAGHPTWNSKVENVSIDGQGTTSKKYFRWNLRAKTSDGTVWTYGDGESDEGKIGKMINATGYIDVDRITAKKNIASSMQGHKMGMTGLYNDLFKEIGLGSHLPSSNYRVAVYQFPFVGFRKYSNNTYEFIGLYTVGPDKGSKETFGYIGDTYPNLMSLEGPDHDPLGTRFLHPWVDVTYDYENETQCFGGENAWDCDAVGGGLKTDKAADAAAVLALYESEWAPAYDIVYHCSPYIASLSDALSENGYASLSAANEDISNFLKGSTGGIKNSLLSFYDSNYDIIFYRKKENELQNLTTVEGSSAHNVLTYLGLTGTPSTSDIIAARAAKFKEDAPDYWDMDQTLYHYCFCILFGATDNFAKNSYPFKFRGYSETLATGESVYCKRWGWRQDDLDTVLATDNNGRNTKAYYVEHGDKNSAGVELFQGGDSSLWVLIRDNYGLEIKQMMSSVINAMRSVALRKGIAGSVLQQTVFNVFSYYCWEQSAKYFSQILYEKDRRWSYIEPWLISPSTLYNNVHPLDQALGDEYQAERLWVERRIAYIFSKYRIGAFTGADTGYNGMALTLARQFTFVFTPAIDLYPVGSLSTTDYPLGNYSPDSMRTPAGTEAEITVSADGQTTNYLHGIDWLSSMGDLSKLVLTDRADNTNIPFSVESERLQELKVGDDDANEVEFNATSLSVKSPTITSIDARNVSTINNLVDLLDCPRLRTCLFEGSGALGLYLPVGAKLTEVSFPSAATTVFMHSLPFLTEENLILPPLSNIANLYVNNCANINPLSLAEDIFDSVDNSLAYATLIWRGISPANIDTLVSLSELSGRVTFENNTPGSVSGGPYVEGTASVSGIYADELDRLKLVAIETYQSTLKRGLSNLFNSNLYVVYDPSTTYIRFEDSNVESVCLSSYDSNHDGKLSLKEAGAVSTLSSTFANNMSIVNFNELSYFTGLTQIYGAGTSNSAFCGCSSLKKITIPENVTTIGTGAFYQCYNLEEVTFKGTKATFVGVRAFQQTGKMKRVNLDNIIKWCRISWDNTGTFGYGSNTIPDTRLYIDGVEVTSIDWPSSITSIGQFKFYHCSKITSITIPQTVTSIAACVFEGCSSLYFNDVNLPLAAIYRSSYITSRMRSTSTLTCKHLAVDYSNGAIPCNCRKIVVLNDVSFYRYYFTGANLKEVRIGGNVYYSTTNAKPAAYGIFGGTNSTNAVKLSFLEIGGRDTYPDRAPTATWFYQTNAYCNCAILHLGYNGVACAPSRIPIGRITGTVYVGPGTSEADDNAVLELYRQDSNWKQYVENGKVKTWWSYDGQYKNNS